MAVLLQYLRLLVPFGVDAEGTLVGRVPLLLQLDAPQLTGFVKPLARTLAKESSASPQPPLVSRRKTDWAPCLRNLNPLSKTSIF